MRRTYLSFTLIGVLAFQSGCGTGPDEKARSAMPTAPESPKSAAPSIHANTGGESAKTVMAESAKVTLALAKPDDPDRVKAGAPLNLVCQVVTDRSGREPDFVIFDVSGTRNKKQVSFGSTGVKDFERQDQTFTFTAQVKAPEKAGSYVVTARVLGVDPAVPGPQPAPAADGTQGKAGSRFEFPAPPPLKIKVIEGKGPV